MKITQLVLGLAIATGYPAIGVQAQSFNCQQSGLNQTELLICQTSDLSWQDEELNRLWKLLTPDERRSMRDDQRFWLQDRNRCGSHYGCVAQNYEARIGDLQQVLNDGIGDGHGGREPPGHSGSIAQSFGGSVFDGPGTKYSSLARLQSDEEIELLEQVGNVQGGYPWFKVRFKGNRTGYHWGGNLCGVGFVNNGLSRQCDAPVVVVNSPQSMEFISFDLAADRTDAGYPQVVEGAFPGLWSSGMTAALTWPNGKVQIFGGGEYIRYDMINRRADPGYPKKINDATWPGLWNGNIDAAYNNGNGKAYFFKGFEYMRYDIANDRVDPGYPKKINDNTWPGLFALGPIDSAVNAGNGKVYFFSGGSYLRYDIARDRADPGYPKFITNSTWPGVWDYNIKMAVRARPGKLMFFHRR